MLRVALIGCGSISGQFVRSLGVLQPRLAITHLVDIDLARAQRASAAAPGSVAETDYKRVVAHVDAAIIALPHDLHHAVGKTFLDAGKHVLMEKPLANTEAQCLDLIALAARKKLVLSVGYVMRYHPLWNRMGELIRARAFGDVFQLSIWTEQFTDTTRGAWIGQRSRVGGGQLFSHGCHYIDLMLQWMGRPILGTHVGTNFGTPWMEAEGTSNVSIRFANGATAYHFGTWGARGSKLGYAVHAHCTEGMLELNHAEGTITLHRDRSGGDLPQLLQAAGVAPVEVAHEKSGVASVASGRSRTVIFHTDSETKNAAAEVLDFLDAIETGREARTDARSSLQSLRVIWKLYDAEERGIVADLRGLGIDEFTDRALLNGAGQVDDTVAP